MKLITVCVPPEALAKVKQAIFKAGAGRSNRYENACRESVGFSEFRPLAGSNPASGQAGITNRVPDVKLEITCEDSLVSGVIRNIRLAHPYEEPILAVFSMEDY